MQRSLLVQFGQFAPNRLERLVDDALFAENLGIEGFWCLPEAGPDGDFRTGAPGIWIAALAGRTKKIRLGWGVAGLLPPDRPPIRVAEQCASIDLASEGRLDLALLPAPCLAADSDSAPESDRPGGSSESGRDGWDESVRMMVDMWDRAKFSWTSSRFEVPVVDVLPKPVQVPHPPIWLVGWSVEHARRAGLGGMGFLDVSGGNDDTLEIHRDTYVEARHASDPNDLVSVSAYGALMGDSSEETTRERLDAWESAEFDHAVVRIDPGEEDPARTRQRIRSMSGETSSLH